MRGMKFEFLPSGIDRSLALPGTYNPFLVVLSIVAAVMAAYIAFFLLEKLMLSRDDRRRRLWLISGALAMGAGIWTMHFLGMLAFSLPMGVSYDLAVTLISMLPSIAASGITISFLSRQTGERLSFWRLNAGGLIMGVGIGTMHYTGMAAMMMEADMYYDPVLFVLSILVAHIVATIAIFIKLKVTTVTLKVGQRRFTSALVMGCAVSGMHYTAMKAAYFFPLTSGKIHAFEQQIPLDPAILGILVSIGTLLLMGSALAMLWSTEPELA